MTSISTGNCLRGVCAHSYTGELVVRPSVIAILAARFRAERIRSTLRSRTGISPLQKGGIDAEFYTPNRAS
ncbi:hypothetical protein BDV38DRAFT_238828 [Aspergillus pseudotamarii]|uniref:Uncharacterized protein n=1 Tax=Aspergillus pseudotamarii TaxID=132259 RepID=A0A5N6T4G6_ASPPS|nr:uncharacterized protein BDV38DRAFT_238828 [Aspergillus pseudotamarii]KAE8141159.1 hypothetical protein BDV38DRAFT_238828 [Aspergillus pseudotamarii]